MTSAIHTVGTPPQAQDAYAVIATAERTLRQDVTSVDGWRLWMAGYAALGLATPARRRLQAAPFDESLKAELAALLPRQEARIPWSRLAAQFQANLDVFAQRCDLAAEVQSAWRENLRRLELYEARDGNWQVYSNGDNDSGRWIPALFPHRQHVDQAAVRAAWQGRIVRTLAVNGIGLGYAALDLVRASRNTFLQFSPVVAVLEPSLLAWAVTLHLHDWRDVLSEPRVRICCGAHTLTEFEAILHDRDRATPVLIRGGPPWAGEFADEQLNARIAAIAQERESEQANRFREINAKAETQRQSYSKRISAANADGGLLRVLGVTSRYTTVLQYAMRDWLAAFARAGHAVRMAIEPDDAAHFSPLRVLDELESFQPDLMLAIDHLQFENGDLYPPALPSVCWIQDNLPHLFRREAGAGVRPREFVIGYGFDECVGRFGYPAARFLPTRIPCNPQKLCDPNESERDLAAYRCDVMFASNATTTFDERLRRCRERFNGEASRLFNSAFEQLETDMRHPWFEAHYDFDALTSRAMERCGLVSGDASARHEITTELRSLADQHLRESAVRAVARWADQTGKKFHLYGRGWDALPDLARFARGSVAPGVELGRAFRAAAISLHLGCNAALHQRVLDGLCAGGFFLLGRNLGDTEFMQFDALVRWYESHKRPAPFPFVPADVAAPVSDWMRRIRFWAGLEPDGAVEVTESRIDWWYQRRNDTAEDTASGIWADLPRVVFGNENELAAKIEYFLANADERRDIAGRMREAVVSRYTYDVLVRQLIGFVARGLRVNEA